MLVIDTKNLKRSNFSDDLNEVLKEYSWVKSNDTDLFKEYMFCAFLKSILFDEVLSIVQFRYEKSVTEEKLLDALSRKIENVKEAGCIEFFDILYKKDLETIEVNFKINSHDYVILIKL